MILEQLRNIVRGMGFEVIDEQKSQDAGSGLVRVYLERESPQTTFEAVYYYVVVLYIDKALTDKQREKKMINFLERLRYQIDINKNNFGSQVQIQYAGSFLVDINERIEGFKISYAFSLKI